MTQVGSGLHDGVDFFEGGLGFGFGGHDGDCIFKLGVY